MLKSDDDGRYEATSREVQTIEFLAGLECQLRRGEQNLEERIKLTPRNWQLFKSAQGMITRVLDGVYDTLPKKVLKHMLKLSESGEVVVRPRPIRPDYVQILQNEDIKFMVNMILKDECAMCDKYKHHEWKPCQLRKLLMRVAPPSEFKKNDMCPFMYVVSECAYGDYYTIKHSFDEEVI